MGTNRKREQRSVWLAGCGFIMLFNSDDGAIWHTGFAGGGSAVCAASGVCVWSGENEKKIGGVQYSAARD